MQYFFIAFIGVISGVFCTLAIIYTKIEIMKHRVRAAEKIEQKAHQKYNEYVKKQEDIKIKLSAISVEIKSRYEELSKKEISSNKEIDQRKSEVITLSKEADEKFRRQKEEIEFLSKEAEEKNKQQKEILDQNASELKRRIIEFEKQVVSYSELKNENSILKRDLQNLDVHLNKVNLDNEIRDQKQALIKQKSDELGQRYLDETVSNVVDRVGPNNFSACKQRLLKVINWCREIGFEVTEIRENELLADLKTKFERAVRLAFEKEEQARIKAQIREEEKLKREMDREVKQAERERAAIKAALEKALSEAKDKHSEEIQRLEKKLAEAEEKSKRAISQAQLTKAGNVYVISNIGSFGKDVYKIGMTRRLEPEERVRELSSASVPFPYDVHMMISCLDAPKLENALHKSLHKQRVNRANPRKEFFKTDLEAIVSVVRENHGEIEYVADPEALEYNQSISMPEDDADYIESVFESVEDEDGKPMED